MNSGRVRRGFTLLEAMAAVVLLGIGIVGSLASFSTMIRTEDRVRETERMQRLAQDKLSELIATGQASTSTDGDFTDRNIEGYTWSLESNASGITDLDSVTLTVSKEGATQKAVLDTLVYVPPVGTTGATAP